MKHKLRSQALTAILSVVMIIGLLPTMVLAANTATVTINGKILTDGEPLQCGEGTAVWDEENGTLTLNNATINQETTDNYTVRVSNGELKVVLIGENKITSTSKKAFYCGSVDLTIQGTEGDSLTIETDSDGLQIDNGNLTIDGCNVDITSTSFGGMMCFGILTIQNGADITIDSYENSLIGNDGLFITNSTVNAIVHAADYATCAVSSKGDLNIENSTLDASSESDSAIYSLGTMSITDSVVKAQSPGSGYTIYGAGGLSLTGTWLDNVDNEAYLYNANTVENCVIIDYEAGMVEGNPVIKRDVELCNGVTLTIPEQTSLTMAEGMTFTNNGIIILNGDFINSNAFVICADGSHVGGTATCTSKAICVLCGNEYGDLVSHNLTKTEAQAATCTEEGNAEFWYCETCHKYFSDSEGKNEITTESTVIQPTGHSYGEPVWNWSEDGKTCTVTFTCSNDETHKETQEAKVTLAGQTPATCTEAGVTTYTATVEFNGQTYTDTKDVADIPATGHSFEDGKCTVCGAIAPDFKVVITAGANGTWQKGTKDGLSFTSNASYEHFQKVRVDGKDLDASNYTVKEGSTIVTLKASYLETLSIGKHTLSIVSDTGTAATEFTIKAAPAADNTQSPQTGDSSNLTTWFIVMLTAGTALSCTLLYSRKRKYNR